MGLLTIHSRAPKEISSSDHWFSRASSSLQGSYTPSNTFTVFPADAWWHRWSHAKLLHLKMSHPKLRMWRNFSSKSGPGRFWYMCRPHPPPPPKKKLSAKRLVIRLQWIFKQPWVLIMIIIIWPKTKLHCPLQSVPLRWHTFLVVMLMISKGLVQVCVFHQQL